MLAHGVHAGFALIRSLGYGVYPKMKTRLEGSPKWVTALMLWSMSLVRPFRVLLATGKAECGALIDAMVSAAPSGAFAPAIAAMRPRSPIQTS